MYQTLYFSPTNPTEVTEFLNKEYKIGWEFISFSEGYYVFKKISP